MEFYNEDDLERAGLYELFSSFFMQEPSFETLTSVKEIFDLEFDDTLYEIRTDFKLLFSEPGGNLLPYESLYTYFVCEPPGIGGKVTEEVQKFYQSADLILDEELDLIPDHLSAELLFMSYLIENSFIEQQKGFLEYHLSAWVPDYCESVQIHARTTFYKEVADLLREFILKECEDFGITKLNDIY